MASIFLNSFTNKVPQSNLIAVVKFKFKLIFVFGFFKPPLSHTKKKLDIFSNTVFALSCDKDLFCCSHWVTLTNEFFVCRTHLLGQTKLPYVKQKKWLNWSKIKQKIQNKCIQIITKTHRVYKKQKNTKKKFSMFGLFLASFLEQIHFLSQWLSATNKKVVCRSDWAHQTKQIFVQVTQFNKQYLKNIQYLCGLWQRNKKKKTSN